MDLKRVNAQKILKNMNIYRWPLWSSGMSVPSQVDGLELVVFFLLGPRRQMRLEHPNHNHKPSTTAFVCGDVCQLLAEGQGFPPGTPVSSASSYDCYDMTSDVESGVTLIGFETGCLLSIVASITNNRAHNNKPPITTFECMHVGSTSVTWRRLAFSSGYSDFLRQRIWMPQYDLRCWKWL